MSGKEKILTASEMELFPRAFLDKVEREKILSGDEKAAQRYRQYESYILDLCSVSDRIRTVDVIMRLNPGWTEAEARADIRAAQTELARLLELY